jgi:PAS domain S-box-containing protein
MLDRSLPGQLLGPPASAAGGRLGRALGRFASIFGMSALAVALLIALLGFDLWRAYHDIEAQAFSETRSLVRVFEAHVDRDLGAVDEMLRAFADRVRTDASSGTVESAKLEEDARLLQQSLPASGMLFIAADGTIVASTAAALPPGAQVAGAGYFRSVADGPVKEESDIGRLMWDSSGGSWFIPMSRGIYRGDAQLIGVAVALLRPSEFVNLFGNLGTDRFNALTISQDDGVIVARVPRSDGLVGQSIANGDLYRRFLPAAPEGSLPYQGVLYGRSLIMSYRHLATRPFVVSAAFDANEVFRSWYRMLTNYTILGLALGLAIGVCAWLLARDQARRQSLSAARRIRAIIDGTSSFVFLLADDGTMLETNRTLLDRARIDREEVIGQPIWRTAWCRYSSDMQAKIRGIVMRAAAGETVRGDLVMCIGRERFITVDATFQRIDEPNGRHYIVASGVDVTEHRALEEQLRQSQKMEALGLLAGGIAHDFNNLLASVSHFAEFLTEDLDPASPQQGFAERIRKACLRGKDLVAQILAYAQPNAAERAGVDLAELVAEVYELSQSSIGRSVLFECEPPVAGWAIVLANRAQLTQILLNLCVNAIDSLDEKSGVVRVSVDLATPGDRDHPLRPATLADPEARYLSRTADPAQRYVRICVRDTGSGMTQPTMQRIFDPFYSTKPRGRGTGLGLAIVHSIVDALGGIIEVESTPGAGTIFAVYLPLQQEPGAALPASEREAANPQGSERILIVEDDVDLVEALALGLERAGYEVAVARCPEDALQAIRQQRGRWRLVITDHDLPSMSGLELAREIKTICPALPIILHTGVSDPVSEQRARAAGVAELLRKPATPAELAALVRAVLDRPATVVAASRPR